MMALRRILFWAAALPLGILASSPLEYGILTVADLLNPDALDSNSSISTTGAFEPSHLSKRIQQQCGSQDWRTLSAAWTQAIAMVKKAEEAASNIEEVLKDISQSYYRFKSTESRVQFYTYCAIFGGFAKWPLNAAELQSMLPAAQYVAKTLRYMKAKLDSPQTLSIEVQCNDNWLSPKDPDGKTHPSPNHYWDSRPTRPNLVKNGWIDVGPDGKCTADDMGFTIAQMWGHEWDVITYCPGMFSTWNSQHAAGQTLKDECSAAKPSGSRIDPLVRDKLARTVVHELMHAVSAVGESMTDENGDTQTPIGKHTHDQPCPDDEEHGAYGWSCITKLAEANPQLAIKNADSYSYFAAALYCNGNNWSNGWAKRPDSVDSNVGS